MYCEAFEIKVAFLLSLQNCFLSLLIKQQENLTVKYGAGQKFSKLES